MYEYYISKWDTQTISNLMWSESSISDVWWQHRFLSTKTEQRNIMLWLYFPTIVLRMDLSVKMCLNVKKKKPNEKKLEVWEIWNFF